MFKNLELFCQNYQPHRFQLCIKNKILGQIKIWNSQQSLKTFLIINYNLIIIVKSFYKNQLLKIFKKCKNNLKKNPINLYLLKNQMINNQISNK